MLWKCCGSWYEILHEVAGTSNKTPITTAMYNLKLQEPCLLPTWRGFQFNDFCESPEGRKTSRYRRRDILVYRNICTSIIYLSVSIFVSTSFFMCLYIYIYVYSYVIYIYIHRTYLKTTPYVPLECIIDQLPLVPLQPPHPALSSPYRSKGWRFQSTMWRGKITMNPSRLWFERLPWALFKTPGRSSLAAHGLGVIPI